MSSFQRLLSKYTIVAFGTDESVLFIEVSFIQECPIEKFHLLCYIIAMYYIYIIGMYVV